MRELPKVLLFFNFFAENCMKMEEFGPPGVSLAPPLVPLLGVEKNSKLCELAPCAILRHNLMTSWRRCTVRP